MRLFGRPLALLFAAALVAPLQASTAHPRLLKATPAADSRLPSAPRQLELTFNESLDLALTRVTLLQDGQTLRTDSLRLAAGDDRTVIAPVGALTPGRYTVRWQVTGDDGHPVRGEFTFEILPSVAAPGSAAAPRLP
ncbi:MAG: copper resistance protein CopC [Gemmatimonadaceae bacterium]|nr:copper resistance protein CopC [Gemmatimonadaceae bacterium]